MASGVAGVLNHELGAPPAFRPGVRVQPRLDPGAAGAGPVRRALPRGGGPPLAVSSSL